MATPTRLFDLFGNFISSWPSNRVQENTGILGPGSSAPDPSAWLTKRNQGVTLTNIRTAALGDRVAVEARASLNFASYPQGFPFVLASMPDVQFLVHDTSSSVWVQLFVSVASCGLVELALENVPVEIKLKAGFCTPHPRTWVD